MLIGIYGNYGAGNIGDELVGKGILHMINNLNLETEGKNTCIVFAHNTSIARKYWKDTLVFQILPAGLRSFFTEWYTSLLMLKNCNLIVFGGGTLFTETPKKSFRLWMWHFTLLKLLNKNIIILGQGFSSLKDSDNVFKLINMTHNVSAITARDEYSSHFLASKTSTDVAKKIVYAPDPIFALPCQKPLEKSDGKLTLVFSLRLWSQDATVAKKTAEVINNIVKKCDQGVHIVGLPMHNEHEKNDYTMFEKVKEYLDKEISLHVLKKDTCDISIIEETVRRADFVLGMRLHANLLAVRHCKNFLAIDYMGKTRENLKSLGLEDQVIDLDDWIKQDSSSLAEKIIHQLQNPDIIKLHKAHYRSRILSYTHTLVLHRFFNSLRKKERAIENSKKEENKTSTMKDKIKNSTLGKFQQLKK